MKNVNTDIILFDDIFPNKSDGKIDLMGITKGIPAVHTEKVEEGLLRIPKLNILFSISATEETDENKKPLHDDDETPANTFYMDQQYQILLRVTETSSGRFADLGTLDINPSQNRISLCRRIYHQKGLYQFQDVPVAAPPDGKDLCALKVLIQRKDACGKWIVQSMHPIRLIVEE